MIAKLKGQVDSVGASHVVLDVGGVGYLVFCPLPTIAELPAPGATATLLIDTHVREDHIHLYGFADTLERDWFRLLQTVQGVGARVALGILSALGPAQLAQAIAAQDKAPLTKASGVGGKLGARIVAELRDKVPALVEVLSAAGAADGVRTGLLGPMAEDAVSALVNLGYGRVDAFGAVSAAAQALGDNARVETLIRSSLRELAS